MDKISIFKDISLLIVGGFITFLFNLFSSKVQTRKPDILWRFLPPAFFPSKGITSFNLVIENVGNCDAENIRIAVSLPKHSVVEAFDIAVSESATKFKVDQNSSNEFILDIPVFYKNIECILSFFTKNIIEDDIKKINVSIVGSNVIGKSAIAYRKSFSEELKSLANKEKLIAIVTTFIFLIIFSYEIIRSLANANYLDRLDIADIYIKTGNPEIAINLLENANSFWWFPTSTQLNYKLAQSYASINNTSSAIYYLSKAIKDKENLLQVVKSDKLFDKIRQTPEFLAILQNKQSVD